jgi:tetratricopeptide (TPR) repeat protein
LLFAGRHDEAMRTIKTTLEVDPNFRVALNQLGRIYIRQQRYAEAIVELEKARKLAPEGYEPADADRVRPCRLRQSRASSRNA